MKKNNFSTEDLPSIGPDNIYGEVSNYGQQLSEVKLRRKVASKKYDNYLKTISNHHSIPVMDNEVRDFLSIIPLNGSLLDIGGCWGWHWRKIQQIRPDIKIVILELIRENLEHAKNVLSDLINNNIFLVHGNANNLPFKDCYFDGVWSVQTTHLIPKLENVYKEIYRVLKPGGNLSDYNLNYSYLTKLIYLVLKKKYILLDKSNTGFYLRRSNEQTKLLLERIFNKDVKTRFTEIIFSPEYRLPMGGMENSTIGKLDSKLSNYGFYLQMLARQRSFHVFKPY